jgi:hypothetical protein
VSHNDLQKGQLTAHDAQHALLDFFNSFTSVENKGALG